MGVSKLEFDLREFFLDTTRVYLESEERLVDSVGFILFGAGDLPARESPPEDDDIISNKPR